MLNMHYSELGVTGATVIAHTHQSKSCIFFHYLFTDYDRNLNFGAPFM
jgi:hypothetical protein